MSAYLSLVSFIENNAEFYPNPEWAIFCKAEELNLLDDMENAFMASINKFNFKYSLIAGYYMQAITD